MGYDLHITRRAHFWEQDGPVITLAERQAHVAQDPKMRLDGFAEATGGEGGVLRVDNPGIAVWTAYSGHGKDGNMAWFVQGSDGASITVKNPDPEIIRQMWRIAQRFNARVFGDEDEEYGPDGQVTMPTVYRPAWWQFWKKR